jgi:hypothetical protein
MMVISVSLNFPLSARVSVCQSMEAMKEQLIDVALSQSFLKLRIHLLQREAAGIFGCEMLHFLQLRLAHPG